MNTTFSYPDSSDTDSETLDNLVNPRPISLLIQDLENEKQTVPKLIIRKDQTVTSNAEQISELKDEFEYESNLNYELGLENKHLKETIAKLQYQLTQHERELAQSQKAGAEEAGQDVKNKYRRKIKEERKNKNEIIESNRKLIKTLEEKNELSLSRLREVQDKHSMLEQVLHRSESNLKASEEKCKELENANRIQQERCTGLEKNLQRITVANRQLQRTVDDLTAPQTPPPDPCCNIL